jgi:hypothetical protein
MAFKEGAARFVAEDRFTSELGRFDEESPFGKCRPTGEVDATSKAELLSKILKSDEKSRPKKQAKKRKQKKLKKQGAKTAVAKVLQKVKNLRQDFGSSQVTEDAIQDGKHGAVGMALHVINPMTYGKRWLLAILLPALPYIILFSMAGILIGPCAFAGFSHMKNTSDSGEEGNPAGLTIETRDTGTFSNQALTLAEIEQMIEDSGADPTQAAALRFALSKVGMPYSQPLRASGLAYDCSSLAYYAWQAAGVDLSNGNGYPPTAAAEAQFLSGQGRRVTELMPGDLVFYGRGGNGRFMDIYHVAIYIGNGKTVEAYNTRYGVIVESIRTQNLVLACRPGR